MPTAVRLYLTKVTQTRRIPFPLEAEAPAEVIPVDEDTQVRMDGIGRAWRKSKR